MSEIVRIACPSCGQGYKVQEAKLGQQATCKKCGKPFVLQLPETVQKTVSQALPPPPKKSQAVREEQSAEIIVAELVESQTTEPQPEHVRHRNCR